MADADLERLSFEQAFKELEQVVARLEGGDLTLEESIALFERGQQLAAYCGAKLDEAELRIRRIATPAAASSQETLS
ncbi:MAG: exodeoxyribonuclease VII small subunit [Chloroflexi bacterium]|nr:MAG: exodeoxyribonuclease VII small subunit [Chloroflexota bacterium]